MDLQKEMDQLLTELAIKEYRAKQGKDISGGLKRLTSFAMALIGSPTIILLDEPTNDVDPIRREKQWQLLQKLAHKGHTIIIVTHNLLEVEKYADRYILMNHGKVLEDKNLKKQSIKINDRNYMTVNFLNLSDLKSVIVPSAIQTNINDEELMIEMELENSQVLEAVDWVMKLVIERKIQNYKVSPKSLNETYGELIDENDKKL